MLESTILFIPSEAERRDWPVSETEALTQVQALVENAIFCKSQSTESSVLKEQLMCSRDNHYMA